MKGLRFTQREIPSQASPLKGLLNGKRKIREKAMNKTETLFSLLLEDARQRGEINRWEFEAVKLKTGPATQYIPDFLVVLPTGRWHIVEIKGHLEDDAAVKFKDAAGKFKELSFTMLRRKAGAWQTIYHIPAALGEATKIPIDPAGIRTDKKNKNPGKSHGRKHA
jgi:hypothetical protein